MFTKQTYAIITDEFNKKTSKIKTPFFFGSGNDVETALAGAYISYLLDQGILVDYDEADDLCEKIADKLKSYKNKAKKSIT